LINLAARRELEALVGAGFGENEGVEVVAHDVGQSVQELEEHHHLFTVGHKKKQQGTTTKKIKKGKPNKRKASN
jgi:hypothetical protein